MFATSRNERPPNVLSLGLGLQYAMLAAPGIVLTPTLLIRAAGGSDAYLSWAVWAALVISAVTTAVQAVGIGRVGAGYVLLMGSSSAFLAICVTALEQGGPGLLATLIIIWSLFQFALAARLSVLRRVFTPMVAGTVLMLRCSTTPLPSKVSTTIDSSGAGSPAAARRAA